MVLETLAETLCKFLDTHYFVGAPTADEMTAHVKAEEEFMEGHDDIITTGKGEAEAFDYEAFYDHPVKPSAEHMLHAYEFMIRESAVEPPVAEGRASPALPSATPAPEAAAPPAAKKTKKVKKAKAAKRGAVAAKPKAARRLAKPSAHAARTLVRV